MSHLDKFDAVIHDIIEATTICCDNIFPALPFMPSFAAASGALDIEAC